MRSRFEGGSDAVGKLGSDLLSEPGAWVEERLCHQVFQTSEARPQASRLAMRDRVSLVAIK